MITFPEDLFYPIGVHTVGIIVKKGIPHPADQQVLWVRAGNDGLLKHKGKRLPNSKVPNDYPQVIGLIKGFIASPSQAIPNIHRFQKAYPIDFSDLLLELVPENYLDETFPTADEIRRDIEQVIRDTAAFLIRERKEGEYDPEIKFH